MNNIKDDMYHLLRTTLNLIWNEEYYQGLQKVGSNNKDLVARYKQIKLLSAHSRYK